MTAIPRFVKVWSCDPGDPGSRLRLDFPFEKKLKVEDLPGACAILAEERVLPEKASNPDARHVEAFGHVFLNRDDMERLHAALGELLSILPKERS